MCRYLNADILVDNRHTLGPNLFAYCCNNPINMADDTGNLPFLAITAAVGAVLGAVVGGVVAAKNGGNVLAGIGIGAAAGALIGSGVGAAAGAALAGSLTATAGAVAAGGKALVAAMGSGGLGAGSAYVAKNLAQAVNTSTPTAQAAASQMHQVREKGKAGEAAANIVKNTIRIPSLSGTAAYRIPDGLDYATKTLTEVKNYSGKLSYTNQLRDFAAWSQQNGFTMYIKTNTRSFTGPLQEAIDSGLIHIIDLG